ncbi:hypothetical protein [Ferruginibacter sp.]
MKHAFLTIFSLLLFAASYSQDTAKVVARAEVIRISAKDSLQADKDVINFISSLEKARRSFSKFFIIGPKLWSRLQSLKEFSSIQQGNVTFRVPKLLKDGSWKEKEDMQGKALQSMADFETFWNYMETSFSISKAQLSPVNTTEKFIDWQYFAKLEEGLRALQVGNTRIMLHFTDGKLFFIELSAE